MTGGAVSVKSGLYEPGERPEIWAWVSSVVVPCLSTGRPRQVSSPSPFDCPPSCSVFTPQSRGRFIGSFTCSSLQVRFTLPLHRCFLTFFLDRTAVTRSNFIPAEPLFRLPPMPHTVCLAAQFTAQIQCKKKRKSCIHSRIEHRCLGENTVCYCSEYLLAKKKKFELGDTDQNVQVSSAAGNRLHTARGFSLVMSFNSISASGAGVGAPPPFELFTLA